MGHWLAAAFADYGYAVIIVGIYLEGCGLPLPGETVLLAGGFFARQGSLSVGWVMAAALFAAIAGDNTGYWIGRRGGRAWVERHGRWVGLTPPRLDSVDRFFARHGAKTILIARFLSGVRAFAPMFAGISRIPWRRFASFDAASCLLWSVAVTLLGYGFGESWSRVEHIVGRAGLALLALAVGVVLLSVATRHRERVLLWVRESLPGRLTQRQLWLLVVELTVLGTLARLAGRVFSHHADRVDAEVTEHLTNWSMSLPDLVQNLFAALGSAPVALIVVVLAVAWCLLVGKRRREIVVLVGAYAASLALSIILGRALLWWTGTLGIFSGLLSGNALVAATAFGATAILLTRRSPQWRWPAALLDAALVLLIGASRVVHRGDLPSGVLAGLAVSTLLLLLATYVLDVLEANAAPLAGTSPASPLSPEGDAAPPSAA